MNNYIKPNRSANYTKANFDDLWYNSIKESDICFHSLCMDCHGTGIKRNGEICIHSISCLCPKCRIT